MTIRVMAVAPYPGLRDLIAEVSKSEQQLQVMVGIGDLQEGLLLARQAEEEGYDMILSRGGTASLIRQEVNLPVIDIPVSGYDILRVLTLVKDSTSKVGIIGFPNVCSGAKVVRDLMQLDIPIYQIENESQARKMLQTVQADGIELVLGDVITVTTAQQMGMNGILITSGKESVSDALEEVKRVYDWITRGRRQMNMYQSVLETDPSGVLVIHKNRHVVYMNKTGKKLTGWTDDGALGQSLFSLSPELDAQVLRAWTTEDTGEGLLTLNREMYRSQVDITKTLDGSKFAIVRISPDEYTDQENVNNTPLRVASLGQFVGSSTVIRELVKDAKRYARLDVPVWIEGELGSGRTMLAQGIHDASARRQGHFIQVDHTQSESEEYWKDVLRKVNGGTLYVREIERFSKKVQLLLATWIREQKHIRIIASSRGNRKVLAEKGLIDAELTLEFGEWVLSVPALRDRSEDIEEICRVVIADFNSLTGSEIVGVSETVLEVLKQRPWEGNIKELIHVVQKMLFHTSSPYVELESVQSILAEEAAPTSQYNSFELYGTLEEIEKKVIYAVLQEENMNQTKAAQRLGINRSTLWRKMKDMLQ